jgi:hypothetical protein
MSRDEFSAGFSRRSRNNNAQTSALEIKNAVSDSNSDPQSSPPPPADEQQTSASDSTASDSSAANDDVEIDASTADALRFWLRLVALS